MATLVLPVPAVHPSLAALVRRRPFQLLPILGRPLLAYQLDTASSYGFERVVVLSDDRPETIRRAVGNGQRWGLKVEVRAVGRGLDIAQQLERVTLGSGPTWIHAPTALVAPSNDPERRQPPASGLRDRHGWLLARWEGRPIPATPAASSGSCTSWRLDSPGDVHRAHLDLMVDPGAVVVPGFEVSPGIIVARGSRFSLGAVLETPVFVGAYARCSHQANLGPHVALGDHALVDESATLRRAVVMPGTYVGRMLEVDGVILDGQVIVNAADGTVAVIGDDLLLADLDQPVLGARVAAGLSRLAGLLIAAVALPVTALAWLSAGRPRRRPVTALSHRVRYSVDGGIQRQTITLRDFNHRRPILRWVGRLANVIRGDLALVGNPPLPPAWAETLDPVLVERWLQAPVGLFGHAQELWIRRRGAMELQEMAAAAAYYTGTRSTRSDLGHLVRGLLHAFGWRSWAKPYTPRPARAQVRMEV